MDTWAKANPKLAAAKAERDRTRGTSSTTNPLMKDMKANMPKAAPKVSGGAKAAASTSGPKFNPSSPKISGASKPISSSGGAKAAASTSGPKFNPSAPKISSGSTPTPTSSSTPKVSGIKSPRLASALSNTDSMKFKSEEVVHESIKDDPEHQKNFKDAAENVAKGMAARRKKLDLGKYKKEKK
ncbi:hypothetical protein [Synechococcus phage MA01]